MFEIGVAAMKTWISTVARLCGPVFLVGCTVFGDPGIASAQDAADKPETLQAGKNLLETKVYTQEEDQKLLELFAGLRVSDVVDGMDPAGLRNVGLMSPDIRPVWKDTQRFTHRFIGIAVTARYVPTNRPLPARMEPAEFDRWSGQWYGKLSPEPFVALIRKGTALVIEDAESADVGSIGSNNIMGWKAKGCVGVVTSAGARDTDEVAIERVPLYFKAPARGIRPGRNEIESVNRPVVVGGVLVMPGDVIVADGDGVVVVPRAQAAEVARYARGILEGDKAGRRKLYRKLGLPPDESVR
jgi:4-hydroxy-4-methyl-2-oxoglutarate aldolase